MSAKPALEPLATLSASLADLVAAAAPPVVAIHSHRSRSSGFVWKPGLIVTADEALAEEGEIAVMAAGGRQVAGKIVGRDPTTDIALLRADVDGATPAALQITAPALGALAVVVGSREGDAVAALGMVATSGPAWRSMRGGEIDVRLELDLSMRRHAEGGIAVDASGHTFGMAVFGPRRRVLVIPAATIARVAGQLETHGKIARGYLGLGLQPVRLDRVGGTGVIVMSVLPEGPGAKAGILQGDIVDAWNDRPITSLPAMLRTLEATSVGTVVKLSLRRAGEGRSVEITIGERP